MLPTSFRHSCPVPPDDDDDDDAVPAPPPPPWLATASCWPVADDDFFEGLKSRLGRRLGVPRPGGVPADADTVVLPMFPTTNCCPTTRAQSPLGLVLSPAGFPHPLLPDPPSPPIAGRPDRPPLPLLNRRTRPRTRPLLRAVGSSSGASTLWLTRAPIQREIATRCALCDSRANTVSFFPLFSFFFIALFSSSSFIERRAKMRTHKYRVV